MSAVAGVAEEGCSRCRLAKRSGPSPRSRSRSPTPPPVKTKTQLVHTAATVKSINKSDRSVVLKKDNGEEMTVEEVPQSVKGFENVKAGDKVDVDYYESLAISMAPAGTKRA